MDAQQNNVTLAQFKAVLDAAKKAQVELDYNVNAAGIPTDIWQRDHLVVSADVADSEIDIVKPRLVREDPTRTGQARLVEITSGVPARDAVLAFAGDGRLGRGVALNHLVSICPVNLCPADEPQPVPAGAPPLPAWRDDDGGRGVFVKVIDTGLAEGYENDHPWLTGGRAVGGTLCEARWPDIVTGDGRTSYTVPGEIRLYAGHGEFIAGVLRCVAPATRVSVSNALQWAGAATVYDLRDALLAALDEAPDIISLSAGVALPGEGHPALEDVLTRLGEPGCRTLLVAAAGNDGEGDGARFFPAYFAGDAPDRVVAVGALRTDRKGRACFSNHPGWVSVYEDGERLVNAFPVGRYTYQEPPAADGCRYYPGRDPLEDHCTCVDTFAAGNAPVRFDGMASWSGTSFATPIVVARIARHMSENGVTGAREAWRQLRESDRMASIIDDGDRHTELRMFRTKV
jgi:hypothetical protein